MNEDQQLSDFEQELLEKVEEILEDRGDKKVEAQSILGFCSHLSETVPQARPAFQHELGDRLVKSMQRRLGGDLRTAKAIKISPTLRMEIPWWKKILSEFRLKWENSGPSRWRVGVEGVLILTFILGILAAIPQTRSVLADWFGFSFSRQEKLQLLVDNFNTARQNVVSAAGSASGFASDRAILGVERDIEVEHLSGGGVIRVVAGSPGGALVFSLGNDSTGTTLISYDGEDSSAALDPDGLCSNPPGCGPGEGVDLTDGGKNDRLHFEIQYNNIPFPVELRVYSGSASAYSRYLVMLPGSIELGDSVDLLVPFADFEAVGGGADVTNVGAFEMFLDGSSTPGAKLELDFIGADSNRDFGDALGAMQSRTTG